jgi:hypothetical protein
MLIGKDSLLLFDGLNPMLKVGVNKAEVQSKEARDGESNPPAIENWLREFNPDWAIFAR